MPSSSSSSSSSSSYSLRTHPLRRFHITRRGKIHQSTNERYLRDDLGYGTVLFPDNTAGGGGGTIAAGGRNRSVELVPYTIGTIIELFTILASTSTTSRGGGGGGLQRRRPPLRLIVVDTNVLLHHMDVLEFLRDDDTFENNVDDDDDDEEQVKHYAIANAIIIPQTALEECRHRSLVMYRRATDLVRSSSNSSMEDDKQKKRQKKKENGRVVIVFADVHHVDTQLINSSNTPSSLDADTNNNNNDNDEEMATTTTTTTTINDENDARLRSVALFYGQAIYNHYNHTTINDNDEESVPEEVEVIFLSDDVQSRQLSVVEQQQHQQQSQPTNDDSNDKRSSSKKKYDYYYKSRSVREHVTILQKEDPTLNLLDLVAQFGNSSTSTITSHKISPPPGFSSDGGNHYYHEPHVPSSTLSHGLRTNMYYQGIYRSNRDTYTSGYVTIRQGEERLAISITNSIDINRAVDGDIVAVELFAIDRWLSSLLDNNGDGSEDVNPVVVDKMTIDRTTTTTTTTTKYEQTAGIAADTAEPTVKDSDNIATEVPIVVDDDNEEGVQLRSPTGRIVGIIRRNFHKNFCGSICTIDDISTNKKMGNNEEGKNNNDNEDDVDVDNERTIHPHDVIAARHEREHPDGITSTVVFFSIDQRIPPILLRTTQRERLVGMRILVSIDSWPIDSEYPLGHYVQTLGVTGTKDTETMVLLQEFRIPCEPFPAKVLACLPPVDYKIELDPGRIDLRHIPVLSIDPPGCKDIDDALHCTELPNGNWQVGVHIADVTHYVEAGTAIDLEAANRSTSTYLVNKRLDMLPSLLTTDLCSLKCNVDRFAFSVLWEVTPDAKIVDVEFKKSIIHSIAALTYQQAQSLIDKPDKDCKDDIQAGAVKRLALLARKFRSLRINAGALTLASPEVKFVLDSESLNPTDVCAYTLYEANALVEEFMLLANVTVAKKILRHYPTLSILRRHPAPNRSMFDGLIQKAKTRGISLCIDDSKKLADSLDDAGKILSADPYLDQLLRILSTRCMSPAQYFCSGEYQAKDWHHYGLAAPVYTHFTSPIRRYADVCVHRLLAAAIGVAPLPVFLSSKSHLHDLAANMNRRHRAAQLAGRASVQLHTLIFFAGGDDGGEGGGTKEEDAYILDLETSSNAEPSFTVMVPRYGIEGRVRLTKIVNDECLFRDPERHRLGYKDAKTGEIIASVTVFDKVRVKIWVRSSRDRRELVLDLLEPKILADPAAHNNNKDDKLGLKKKKQKTN